MPGAYHARRGWRSVERPPPAVEKELSIVPAQARAPVLQGLTSSTGCRETGPGRRTCARSRRPVVVSGARRGRWFGRARACGARVGLGRAGAYSPGVGAVCAWDEGPTRVPADRLDTHSPVASIPVGAAIPGSLSIVGAQCVRAPKDGNDLQRPLVPSVDFLLARRPTAGELRPVAVTDRSQPDAGAEQQFQGRLRAAFGQGRAHASQRRF